MKKSTGQKIFKRCIVGLLIVLLIIGTIPITFAAGGAITRFEIDDITIIQGTNGSYATEKVDDRTMGYYRYEPYYWNMNCTLYYSDGSSEQCNSKQNDNDFFYMVSIYTDQSCQSPWEVGEHTARAEYYDGVDGKWITTEFTVTISDETDIESVETQPIKIYQNTGGYFRTDDDGHEFYYYEELCAKDWTIHMKDGDVEETDSYGEFYYQDSCVSPTFNLSDQYNNPWGVGSHTVKGMLLGYEVTAEVIVLESPIDHIEAEEVILAENTGGYEDSDWVYNPDTGEDDQVSYYCYENYYPRLTVYLKDGSVEEFVPSRYDHNMEINGIRVNINIDSDQSSVHPWTVGNTYQATVSVMDQSAAFNVTISKTPVKSMDLSVYRDCYAYEGGEWVTDEDSGEKWFRYSAEYRMRGTITMQDDTVIEIYEEDGFYYNGDYYRLEYSDDQSYENQWDVGTHDVEVEVLNFKTTVPFTINPSPIKSIELEDCDLYEDLDGIRDWMDEVTLYDYRDVRGTVTFKDGTVIHLNNQDHLYYKDQYCAFLNVDNQHEKEWGVGSHQGYLTILGYKVPIQVNIHPNPVKSISADDVKIYEGVDLIPAYEWVDYDYRRYDYYPVAPDLHILLNDGTEDVVSCIKGHYSYTIGGRTFTNSTIEDDQSEDNLWQIGKHQATISFLGRSCTVNIELLENPVKSISVDQVQPIERADNYSESDLRFQLNIEYKDGTSEKTAIFNQGSKRNQTYLNKNGVSVSLTDASGWHIGKGNAFTVKYAGLETTAYVEIVASKDWDYTETDEGIILTKCYTGKLFVPDKIGGKPVVGVSANAFPKSIRYLYLGENVRYIVGTLNYPQLNRLEIGRSLEQFDTDTVRYLPSLESIYISDNNEHLAADSGVVYDKAMTKVLAAAPAYPRLIEIPETVEDIEALSDSLYSNLRYYAADKSAYFTTVDGVTYSKDMKEVITCDRDKEGDFIMPDSVETIRDYAFAECVNLTSVKVSDKVTDIAYRSFANCNSLTSITLPKNLKSISAHAFDYDRKLSDAKLPATLEEIGDNAFFQNALTSADFGNSLKRIGSSAFIGNPLASVVIPDSVESVGSSAFGDTDITQAVIGDSITELSSGVFRSCENLTSVTLGAKVRSIGSNCFESCSSLTDLTINSPSVEVGSRAFAGCSLKDFDDWDKFSGELAYSAFRGTGAEQVSLPSTVTSLAYCSFAGSRDLAAVKLPDTLLKVDSKSFDGTKWFNEQKNGVVYLDKVLYDCKGTLENNTALKVKNGTLSLAEHALMGQSGLTSITLPNGLKRIGNSQFYQTKISKINIPASVTEIGDRAFAGCKTLTNITVDKANPCFTAVDGVLYNKDMTELIYCSKRNAESFKVPVSVTKIDSFAFADADIDELTILRDDVEIAPFAFGFDVVYDRNIGGIYGETYQVTYHPINVICHEDSPANAYAQSMLLDVENTEERAFEIGDADGNGETDLMDVTRIQMDLAGSDMIRIADRVAVDIDRNKRVDIIDATFLQRWLTGQTIPYEIIIKE